MNFWRLIDLSDLFLISLVSTLSWSDKSGPERTPNNIITGFEASLLEKFWETATFLKMIMFSGGPDRLLERRPGVKKVIYLLPGRRGRVDTFRSTRHEGATTK